MERINIFEQITHRITEIPIGLYFMKITINTLLDIISQLQKGKGRKSYFNFLKIPIGVHYL